MFVGILLGYFYDISFKKSEYEIIIFVLLIVLMLFRSSSLTILI